VIYLRRVRWKIANPSCARSIFRKFGIWTRVSRVLKLFYVSKSKTCCCCNVSLSSDLFRIITCAAYLGHSRPSFKHLVLGQNYMFNLKLKIQELVIMIYSPKLGGLRYRSSNFCCRIFQNILDQTIFTIFSPVKL